jgi:hypothetical protein
VGGDAWFAHAGALRLLSTCGGGGVRLWLHDSCDDQEGKPVPIVPCNKHLLWALPAPVGGQLYVRAQGDGVLHAPLQHEWAARRKEVADGEAPPRHSSERRRLQPAPLPPPRRTGGRALSAVESLPPPPEPSAADPTPVERRGRDHRRRRSIASVGGARAPPAMQGSR